MRMAAHFKGHREMPNTAAYKSLTLGSANKLLYFTLRLVQSAALFEKAASARASSTQRKPTRK